MTKSAETSRLEGHLLCRMPGYWQIYWQIWGREGYRGI